MDADAPTKPGSLESFIDNGVDHVAEVGLLTILALVKAWNTYSDRTAVKRIGRRSTDADCVAMQRSQVRIEKTLQALTAAVAELTTAVHALEQKGTQQG